MKIAQGESVPQGYGVAWMNYESLMYEVYMIPFNHLARWGREIYRFLQKPRKSYEARAYLDGYDRGMEAGERYGLEKGRRLERQELDEAVLEWGRQRRENSLS